MPYNAFISYSHAADKKLSPALQAALHRFAKPWYKLRAVRVFRDQTTLAVTPALWPAIESALNESEYLILLASPAAAGSKWIHKEVGHWIAIGRASRLLVVLTEGEVKWDDGAGDFDWTQTTALPRVLSGQCQAEPLFIDLRWARTEDQLSARDSRFQDAVADLAAVLHHRPKDEITGEDVRQHRRTRSIARAATSALIALTLTASIATWQAIQQRQVADRRLDDALTNQSLFLAQQAERLAPSVPQLAMLLSLEGLPDSARSRPYVPQAEVALRRSVAHAQRDLWLVGQNSPLTYGAFSPDGQLAATSSDSGEIRLWNAATGQSMGAFKVGDHEIERMVFTPSGTYIVALLKAGELVVWNLVERKTLQLRKADSRAVQSLAESPVEDLVALGFSDGRVSLVDVARGAASRSLDGPHTGGVSHIAFSSDGQRVISVSGNVAATWDAKSGRMKARLQGHRGPIWSAEFDEAGRLVATASSDGTARVWNAENGKLLGALPGGEQVVAARFTRDAARIITIGLQGSRRLFDVKSQRLLRQVGRRAGWDVSITQAEASANRRSIVLTSMLLSLDFRTLRHLVELVDPDTLDVRDTFDGGSELVQHASSDRDARRFLVVSKSSVGHLWNPRRGDQVWLLEGHTAGIRAGVFGLRGSVVVTASDDGTARSWSAATGRVVNVFKGHTAYVWRTAISPDGGRIATASGDGTAAVWSLATGQRISVLQHDGPVWSVAFDPSGRTLLTTSEDRTARLWNVETRQLLATLRGHNGAIRDGQFTPDGRLIVTASSDRTVRVWDAHDHQLKASLEGHGREVTRVTVSPDSAWAATASYDGLVGLWDLRSLTRARSFRGHSSEVWTVRFSPNGRLLASGSLDGSARIWDVSKGTQRALLGGHATAVTSVDFSDDGRQIVTTSADKTARVWDGTTFEEIGALEGHADGLTHAAFDGADGQILTTSLDGTARLWRVRVAKAQLFDFAQRLLGNRMLTSAERTQFFLSTPTTGR